MGKRLGPGQAEDGRFERRPRIAALILWLLYIYPYICTYMISYIYILCYNKKSDMKRLYMICSKLGLKDSGQTGKPATH